jgi:serine protein kinase
VEQPKYSNLALTRFRANLFQPTTGGIMAKKAQVKATPQTQPQLHLRQHCQAVQEGSRRFENAFKGVARMILESNIEKVVVNARTTYDFNIFRHGKKHVIGMYDEINSFVSYVKDAAENGSSKEMAFVLVGEPGNGKDRKSTRLNSSHNSESRMPSSA